MDWSNYGKWLLVICLHVSAVSAKDLVGNAAIFNPNDTIELENLYTDFLEKIDDFYDEGRIEIHKRPFARSLREVTQGLSDFHYPLLCPKTDVSYLPFAFGSEPYGKVVFALYSSIRKPLRYADLLAATYTLSPKALGVLNTDLLQGVDTAGLLGEYQTAQAMIDAVNSVSSRLLSFEEERSLALAAYPYHIETERLHTKLIEVPAHPGNDPVTSLRKLLGGRIDGLIHGAFITETVIEEDGLAGFHRSFAGEYDICFVVARNRHGAEVEKKVAAAIKALKESPEYGNLLQPAADFEAQWLQHYGQQ